MLGTASTQFTDELLETVFRQVRAHVQEHVRASQRELRTALDKALKSPEAEGASVFYNAAADTCVIRPNRGQTPETYKSISELLIGR